jgi:hypothetical protein
MLPLTVFPVIARSEATKQSRSTTTYVTSHKSQVTSHKSQVTSHKHDKIASLRAQ